MHSRNSPMRRLLLGASACATAAAAHAQGFAQLTFSIDWQGPSISAPDCGPGFPITEGDVLTPCVGLGFGPLPKPRIGISAGFGPPGPGLGLALHAPCVGHPAGTPCKVEVDALDYAVAPLVGPNSPIKYRLAFSVDEFARGLPGSAFPPNVRTEAPGGDSCSDIFIDLGLGVGPLAPFAAAMPGNTAAVDGNGLVSVSGAVYPGYGVVEPNPPGVVLPNPGDNLDALAQLYPAGPIAWPPGGVYFSLDSGFVDPFTGTPNSGSAAANGFRGGDVLKTAVPGGPPFLWAPAALLGLDQFGPDTDDLDALVIHQNFAAAYNPSVVPNDWNGGATDMLLFSVRRGSAIIGLPDSIFGLPISEGDILTTPKPTAFGGVSPFPGIYIAAENLGLVTARSVAGAKNDELDALDLLNRPLRDCNGNNLEDAIDIVLGTSTDINGNGVPDECELIAKPYCFCPVTLSPCGNAYPPGGCRNSSGVGAILTPSGTTSVTNDDLVMTATQMPLNKAGILFMGKTSVPPGPFWDGLRCVGAPIFRYTAMNSGATGSFAYGPGLVAYSIANFPPLGHILIGDTWYWQAWFRDPPGPCATGANTSNAVTTTFTP